MDTKNILKSKTFWANVLAVTLLITNNIFQIAPAELSTSQEVMIMGVMNLIMRFVTKGPVRLK